MTMMDLGPERPGHPSETRQMTEAGRAATHSTAHVSGRKFWLAFFIITLAIAGIGLLLRG